MTYSNIDMLDEAMADFETVFDMDPEPASWIWRDRGIGHLNMGDGGIAVMSLPIPLRRASGRVATA